jgi:hypothetical protein
MLRIADLSRLLQVSFSSPLLFGGADALPTMKHYETALGITRPLIVGNSRTKPGRGSAFSNFMPPYIRLSNPAYLVMSFDRLGDAPKTSLT